MVLYRANPFIYESKYFPLLKCKGGNKLKTRFFLFSWHKIISVVTCFTNQPCVYDGHMSMIFYSAYHDSKHFFKTCIGGAKEKKRRRKEKEKKKKKKKKKKKITFKIEIIFIG